MTKKAAPKITIEAMEWVTDRQDWQVDYTDERNGYERGRRYIQLPEGATEQDVVDFISNE